MASSRAEPEGWERVTGERLTLMQESVVTGELTEEGFERVVEAIQRTAQEHGQPSLLGRTLTWQAETAGKTRTIQATVTSRDGQTYMRVVERLHQMASGLFAGTVAGAGVGLGMAAGVPLAINVLGSGLLAFAFPDGQCGPHAHGVPGDLQAHRTEEGESHHRHDGRHGRVRQPVHRGPRPPRPRRTPGTAQGLKRVGPATPPSRRPCAPGRWTCRTSGTPGCRP